MGCFGDNYENMVCDEGKTLNKGNNMTFDLAFDFLHPSIKYI